MSTNCIHNLSFRKHGNNWWKLLKKKADDHSRGGWLFHQFSRPQNHAGLNPLCDNHLLVFVSWLFAQLSRLPSFLLESKINVDRNILNKITLLRRRSAMREPRRWARRARGRDPRRVVVVWSGSRWGPSGGGCPSQPHPASQRVRDGPDGQWWGWSEKAETTSSCLIFSVIRGFKQFFPLPVFQFTAYAFSRWGEGRLNDLIFDTSPPGLAGVPGYLSSGLSSGPLAWEEIFFSTLKRKFLLNVLFMNRWVIESKICPRTPLLWPISSG